MAQEEALSEWLSKNIKREDCKDDAEFMAKRRSAAKEFLKDHPNAPLQPPQPKHEPGTIRTDRGVPRGRRQRPSQ